MSDQDERPDVSGFGDPREEALWAAYQAMLRRRKEPPPRWSAFDPPVASPEPQVPASPRGRVAAIVSGLGLVTFSVLAIAFWPRGPVAPGLAEATHRPSTMAVDPSPSALSDAETPVGAAAAPPRAEAPIPVPPSRAAEPGPDSAAAPPPPPPGVAAVRTDIPKAVPHARPAGSSRVRRWPAHRATLDRKRAGAVPEPAPVAELAPAGAATRAVRAFYGALGKGDLARAAAGVVPERRQSGPLSVAELARDYASLRAPLRVTKVELINDQTVFVRYHFVTADGRLCLGSATVDTTRRDGDTLIQRIRRFGEC